VICCCIADTRQVAHATPFEAKTMVFDRTGVNPDESTIEHIPKSPIVSMLCGAVLSLGAVCFTYYILNSTALTGEALNSLYRAGCLVEPMLR